MSNFNHLKPPENSIFNYTLDRSHHDLSYTLFEKKEHLHHCFQ